MTKLKALALITMLSATAATGQAATQKGLPTFADMGGARRPAARKEPAQAAVFLPTTVERLSL